jgi:predicted O-linked N-acetylglucosamine transferase (SPINDLY family)
LPNAVLWLIDDNEASTANLRARAAEAAVDVSRLHFSPRTTHAEFCGRLKLADVFLDTYPYNCGSTSNDVINSGTPLVGMYGKTMVSRMGRSIIMNTKYKNSLVSNYDDYLNQVVKIKDNSNDGGGNQSHRGGSCVVSNFIWKINFSSE